uniref:Uncharacterized protein n=1 Tax=Anguilla anguilla TaxID=7936 RepID=A0A0E9UPS2_ANGAN
MKYFSQASAGFTFPNRPGVSAVYFDKRRAVANVLMHCTFIKFNRNI